MTYPLPLAEPETLGLDPAPLARLAALIERHIAEGRHPGAEIAIARHGKLALARSFGEARAGRPADRRTLWLMYSQTKVLTAATLWGLVEEGRLGFGDRIAEHIPEFAAGGKGDITLTQLLTHQAGFPNATVPAAAWTDHALLRRVVSEFTLEWDPGSRIHYHTGAAHWVAAALIEAVTGRDYREVIRERVILPLGLGDELYVGLPAAELERAADMHEPDADGMVGLRAEDNQPERRAAGIPGGGGYGSARALAAFYQCLIADGSLGGVRLFAPRTVQMVTRDYTGERLDDYMGLPMHRGLGPHSRGTGPIARGLGGLAHPRAFGHGGVGSSYGWGDPVSGVSFVFLSNCRQTEDFHTGRMDRLSNLVHAAIVGD